MTPRLSPIRVWLNPDPVWDFLNERGISQNELARMCGISPGYLSQLMTGARCPSPQVRRRLQEALGVSDFDALFINSYSGSDNPLSFQLSENMTVTAHFNGTPTSTPTATPPPDPLVCTATTLGVAPSQNPSLAADCGALLMAKVALEGTGTSSLNWNINTPMSEWTGIKMRGNPKRVKELTIRQTRLSGTIPAVLGELTKLQKLALADNRLTGAIPAELGNLTDLRQLHLERNQLAGSIPAELGNLAKLTYLSLGYNQLTGSIPTELGNLTKLTNLWIGSNQLTGDIPESMENLKKLEYVALSGNMLTGCVPGVWADVPNQDLPTLSVPYCGTTLTYDSYDTTGAAATDGSHAFLMDATSTTSVTDSYYGITGATALLVNASDSEGSTRATFYDSLKVGDVVEWYPVTHEDCWQRYRITAILPDPPGDPPRKLFAVENLPVALDEC